MSFHALSSKYNSSNDVGQGRFSISEGSFSYNVAIKHASSSMRANIVKVEKVNCPTLHAWYLVRKAEYASRGFLDCEKTLVHVTASTNVDSILRTNLDWRKVSRSKFGIGVSFADDADYANRYAARAIGSSRAMIVADVLVGSKSNGASYYRIPPSGSDTTVGNNHVYVKFYDDEFYPKYIVHYTDHTVFIPRRRFMW